MLFAPQLGGIYPVNERVASLYIWAGDRSLTVILACGTNSSADYLTFLESRARVLDIALTGDPIVLLVDVTAHVVTTGEERG